MQDPWGGDDEDDGVPLTRRQKIIGYSIIAAILAGSVAIELGYIAKFGEVAPIYVPKS